jgi:hypothetical protein
MAETGKCVLVATCTCHGSQNRWEPVRFGRFLVEPVRLGTRTGPVPTPKPCLIFLTLSEPAGLTGIPAGFFRTVGTGLPTVLLTLALALVFCHCVVHDCVAWARF